MPTPNTLDKAWFVRPAQGCGGSFNQKEYTVAASTSIKRGDILSFSSSQLVQSIALPGSNNTASSTSGGSLGLVGVAMADIVTGSDGLEAVTGRSTIPVAIFDGNLELAMRIYNATASSAEPQDISFGTTYEFVRYRGGSATDWWYMLSTTTTGEFMPVERYAGSLAGDDYGLMWVRAALSDTTRVA